MRKIGYARVSAPHQNLDRQIAALRAQHCDQIFREKASGKDVKNRPQLEKAIDVLGTGDVLILAEWDRATRVDARRRPHHRAHPCPRCASEGPGQALPGSHDPDRARLHCLSERDGGGRASAHRQARNRWQEGREGAQVPNLVASRSSMRISARRLRGVFGRARAPGLWPEPSTCTTLQCLACAMSE